MARHSGGGNKASAVFAAGVLDEQQEEGCELEARYKRPFLSGQGKILWAQLMRTLSVIYIWEENMKKEEAEEKGGKVVWNIGCGCLKHRQPN